MYYIYIDTETGGLDPDKYSLLTFAAQLVPAIGAEPISTFNSLFLHDPYRVSAAALRVNGIDLASHTQQARRSETIASDFTDWLRKYCGDEKPVPVGWNIGFDLGFLHRQFITKVQWDTLIDYHALDVCALVEFMIIQGRLPKKRKLVDVAAHFGIDTSGAHDAQIDNTLCRLVSGKLVGVGSPVML